MAATNGFFGNLQGPFAKDQELFSKIQSDCKDTVDYVSKIGIHCHDNFDFDLSQGSTKVVLVRINGIDFQIGKTRMLELENVRITSIQFLSNMDDATYIDYQYQKRTI